MTSLSDSLSYAADYTRGLLSRLGDYIILAILSIIPIVNFIAWGYYGRVIKDDTASKEPPKLEQYGDMFVKGLTVFVVGLIWGILIVIISVIIALPILGALALSSWSLIMSPDIITNTWALIVLFIPWLAIMGIITFFISIVALMGIIHMFKTGSFGKAFAVGQILNIIGKIGWLRYLAWLVVSFVLALAITAFTYIPFLGWVILAFLEVLLVIFLARSIGIMYDSAMGITTAPSAPAATPPSPPQPPKA